MLSLVNINYIKLRIKIVKHSETFVQIKILVNYTKYNLLNIIYKLAFIYYNWGYIGVAPINKDNESFFYSGR